ncbi:hypothetical protein [Mycobacterium sp. ZZG]
MNDENFWSATDQLKLIYQWARASYVAPWALLYAVLLRAIATTGPHVMLPGPPAPASLNMGVVLVGRSGAGKGVTDKLSRVVWPADIHEEGLGSGQGIAELFKEQKNPEDRITRALITVSEIDHLAALNAGQGNNTRAALKAALTGDRLGSKGASLATTRAVPADSYRMCLSISAQFGHTAVLMDDVSGGTPQRLAWAPVTDPEMPDEPGPIPDRVLDTAVPSWALAGPQVLMQYGPPEIRAYINAGLLANGRGLGEAIDGHRTLTRLKVAAALAVLDHRMVVSAGDWELSEAIMAKSDDTRNSVLEYDRQAARAKVRDRAIGRAVFDEMIDDRHAKTVRSRILRLLASGPMSRSELRRAMGKQHYREAFDAVLPHLEEVSQVVTIRGEKALHYALNPEFTGEPEFTPGKPSSGGVNLEFTGEPPSNVTDLDSRRSHEAARPKLSCLKWLSGYVEQLREAGHTTVESFAVIEAGHAAGYTTSSIHQARTAHPDMRTVSRKRGRAIWSIVPDQHPPRHESAAAWLDNWLDKQPTATVSPEDAKLAGQAAGHPWQSVRRAAGLSPRITSVPAHGDAKTERVWHISDADDVGA